MNALETGMTNSYLNTQGVADTIVQLTKKTAVSQLEIGKLILNIKTDLNEQIVKLKNQLSIAKGGQKKDIQQVIKVVNGEYDSFIASLPFGKVVANKFAAIAEDKMVAKYIDFAPVAYNSMYAMKDKSEPVWKFLKENGMTSYTSLVDIKKLIAKYNASIADPIDETADNGSAEDALNASMSSAKDAGMKPTKIISGDFNVEDDDDETLTPFSVTLFTTDKVTKEMLAALTNELDDVVTKFKETNKLGFDDIALVFNNDNAEMDIAA